MDLNFSIMIVEVDSGTGTNLWKEGEAPEKSMDKGREWAGCHVFQKSKVYTAY